MALSPTSRQRCMRDRSKLLRQRRCGREGLKTACTEARRRERSSGRLTLIKPSSSSVVQQKPCRIRFGQRLCLLPSTPIAHCFIKGSRKMRFSYWRQPWISTSMATTNLTTLMRSPRTRVSKQASRSGRLMQVISLPILLVTAARVDSKSPWERRFLMSRI